MINRERHLSSVFNYFRSRQREFQYLPPVSEIIPKVVEKLLTDTKQEGIFPVDLEPVMAKRFIRKVKYMGGGSFDGLLFPDRGGFRMHLKSGLSLEEERLNIAHEIGHTFFYKDYKEFEFPKRIDYFLGWFESWSEEHFCEIFARELLMPGKLAEVEVSKLPKPHEPKFEASVLMRLASLFKVPEESMSRRLVEDLGLWEAIIFQIENSSEECDSSDWSIEWMVPNETDSPRPSRPYNNRLSIERGLSSVVWDTVYWRRRKFKIDSDDIDVLLGRLEYGLPQSYKERLKQIKVLFSTSNLGFQLPLFREITHQIICVIPLKQKANFWFEEEKNNHLGDKVTF